MEAGEESRAASKLGIKCGSPTFGNLCNKLTRWRAEFEWLRAGSSVVQQQTIRKWARANQLAFKKESKGWPKFKSAKVALPSLEYTSRAFRFIGGRIRLVGGIEVPVVWSRQLPSIPSSCVLSMDREGHWNISFVVRRANKILPPSNNSIGIDWGVSSVANTTDSAFDLPCGNQTIHNEKNLKDAQRRLSRAKKGSKGWDRAKKDVARIHLRISRQRKDRAFKWARKVVTAFGKIAVEDFKPKFLSNSKMAKKAADGAVGMTKNILITMAESCGRTVALITPAYSTMECSNCGVRAKSRIPLSTRTFVCESCGFTAGRDENAALVIRARAGFNPTDVDDVRLSHDIGCVLSCLSQESPSLQR